MGFFKGCCNSKCLSLDCKNFINKNYELEKIRQNNQLAL